MQKIAPKPLIQEPPAPPVQQQEDKGCGCGRAHITEVKRVDVPEPRNVPPRRAVRLGQRNLQRQNKRDNKQTRILM